VVFYNSGSVDFYNSGSYETVVTNNLTLDSTLSVSAGNLYSTDPQFVDVDHGVYNLQSTSPARNYGTYYASASADFYQLIRTNYDCGAVGYYTKLSSSGGLSASHTVLNFGDGIIVTPFKIYNTNSVDTITWSSTAIASTGTSLYYPQYSGTAIRASIIYPLTGELLPESSSSYTIFMIPPGIWYEEYHGTFSLSASNGDVLTIPFSKNIYQVDDYIVSPMVFEFNDDTFSASYSIQNNELSSNLTYGKVGNGGVSITPTGESTDSWISTNMPSGTITLVPSTVSSYTISVNIGNFEIGRRYNGMLVLVGNFGIQRLYVSVFREYRSFDGHFESENGIGAFDRIAELRKIAIKEISYSLNRFSDNVDLNHNNLVKWIKFNVLNGSNNNVDSIPLADFALNMYKKTKDFGQYITDMFRSITFKNLWTPHGSIHPQIIPSRIINLNKFNGSIDDENISEKLIDWILGLKTMEQWSERYGNFIIPSPPAIYNLNIKGEIKSDTRKYIKEILSEWKPKPRISKKY